MPDDQSEETALTRTAEDSLQRLNTNIATSERILARSRDRYVKFFEGREDFFLRLITRFYPLSGRTLEYCLRCCLERLGSEQALPYLSDLCLNKNVQWSEDLLADHPEKWDWIALSKNIGIPWSPGLIQRFSDRWDWISLSNNEHLPWSGSLIDSFDDHWRWNNLGSNEGIPWSTALLDKHEEKLNWKGVPSNDEIPWSDELIGRYSHRFDKKWLVKYNRLEWKDSYLREYSEGWPWYQKSLSRYVPWSGDLIEKYSNQISWKCLSQNEHLSWSENLIDRFSKRWMWGWLATNKSACDTLRKSDKLPNPEELIEYEETGFGQYGVCTSEGIEWNPYLISKYENYIRFKWMASNKSISWTLELIEDYSDRWDWSKLANEGVYEKVFNKHIDDEMLFKIL